jgi:polyphosphate kinase 2 (PPK2 family)
MTYFDRSYQNRATVEPVMNYCSQEQYDWHMENIVEFEKNMTNE